MSRSCTVRSRSPSKTLLKTSSWHSNSKRKKGRALQSYQRQCGHSTRLLAASPTMPVPDEWPWELQTPMSYHLPPSQTYCGWWHPCVHLGYALAFLYSHSLLSLWSHHWGNLHVLLKIRAYAGSQHSFYTQMTSHPHNRNLLNTYLGPGSILGLRNIIANLTRGDCILLSVTHSYS